MKVLHCSQEKWIGWMDGWMDEWSDGWMDWVNGSGKSNVLQFPGWMDADSEWA